LCLDEPASARAGPYFDGMLARRLAGEPLQYVLGRWAFRGLDLMVDRRVLIPRPETEQVVEVALREAVDAAVGALVTVDLGTGSGAIALSLACELLDAQVWATEVSPDALAVARANLAGIGSLAASRVRLVEGSWFDALPSSLRGQVSLVVSNPPYIADDELLPADVSGWEPLGALRAGPTGLEQISVILKEAPRWLVPSLGVAVIEIAPHQADSAVRLARTAGFDSVRVEPDLAGRPRALVARVGG
jgi:release factor glutamine methyltransferase